MTLHRRPLPQRAPRNARPVDGLSIMERLESRTLMAAAPAVPAPSGLVVATVSATQLNLNWTDNASTETHFVLDRALGSGRFRTIASLPADSTTFSDAGLEPQTRYRYRVRAATDVAASKWATAAATTAAWTVEVAAEPDQVDLTWPDYWTGETGYVVTRAEGRGKRKPIAKLPADTTTFSDTTVTLATTYTYEVTAVTGARRSKPGRGKVTTPTEPTVPASLPPPAAPTALAALAASMSRIDLAWVHNSADELGFKIERSSDGTVWNEVSALGADVTTYAATGLSPSTAYQFRVKAYNATGDSPYSNLAAATTPAPAPTAPAAPSALAAAAASSSRINLTWADNSGDETGFKVERSADGVNFTQVGTVGAGVTTYAATGLSASTAYTFRVCASNATGDSAYSNPAAATTHAPAPTVPVAPSALAAAAASSSRINLTWADNSGDETGFKVEYSNNNGATWTQVGTTTAGVNTYAATGLSAATAYQFRVRASNAAGDSAYSNVAAASTPAVAPAAPTSLGAVAASSSQINLSWTDNSANETGFKVERSTNGVNFTQVGTVGSGITTYAATGLSASTAYTFRVRATNAVGDSAYTNAASANTQAPPTSPVIGENFTSGSGAFIAVDGAWATVGGEFGLTAENSAATTHLNSRSVHSTILAGDFVLTVDARAVAASAPWSNFAVIFGYQDASNYYFFSSNQSNDSATSGLFRVVNGVSTELADVVQGITPGVTYRLRLERAGGEIRAYRDDALVASAADGTFASGRVGLGTRQFQASFDNLLVSGAPLPSPTEPPAAPSGLSASAASSSRVDLSWSDASTNESGFKVERSGDGVNFTPVATVGANVRSYAATGLSASTQYWFRVRATNSAGDSAASNAASATTQPAPAGVALVAPPRAAVDAALAAPLIRYHRALPGGAHTDGAWSGGASVTLAAAAYAGDASADARLLEQARYTLTGGNDITANGGYPAQHERHVTGMFALMKLTPRVWNQLTAAERAKVDLLMKASLVAGAFTTGDANPYIASGQAERTLDGDTNLGRDWNPNYREGMVGSVLVGAAYFGPAQAQSILSSYDHAAFVAELASAGLSNIHETFTWKARNPGSIAPDAATVQNTVRAATTAGYRYYGLPLTDPMGLYASLLAHTYGRSVNAGLNGGAGIGGAGRIVSGAATLPNPGAAGMLTEFDSADAEGPRSSAHYAYDGFRPHQTNLLVLVASGHWQAGSATAADAAAKLEVGNTDLWYKIDRGYVGYAKGASQGTFSAATDAAEFGFAYTRPLWESVLRPYLRGGTSPATPPAAPSGLSASAASSSRVDLSWADNSGDETGFTVERSTNGTTWTQVASVGANVRAYAATGLAASTQYWFRVRATNGAGDSPYSNTASATTLASTPSGPYVKPSAANTGLRNPGALTTVNGTFITSANGQVIENKHFTGRVNIAHTNVTFRNCKFDSDLWSTDGNGNHSPSVINTGSLVEDCEFNTAGFMGRGVSFTRCYFHSYRDTDVMRNVTDATFTSCYVEDWYATGTEAHMDFLQYRWTDWGVAPVSQLNLVFRGNYWNLNMGYAYQNQQNAVLWIADDSSSGLMVNVTIEHNWFKSGGYPVRLFARNDASIQVNHNVWEASGFLPILVGNRPGQGYSNIGFTGNQVWRDGTLQPFEKPGGINGDLFGLD